MAKLLWIFLGVSFLFPQDSASEIILDKQSSSYVELEVIHSPNLVAQNDSLIFRFRVRPPYHINSGSPLIKGLIPTTVSLQQSDGNPLTLIRTDYPPSEILDISGFRTTVYFKGPHDLTVNFKANNFKDGETIDYGFHYQACKDDECYAPESISGSIELIPHLNNQGERGLSFWMSFLPQEILWLLAFAFLGGLILNFTPCVLPILSLKLLSLSAMKNTDVTAKKKYVTFHIIGVLMFFTLIATGVILLKAGGERIGWGFQFQNPHYIFFITLLLGVVTLNLLGVYEIPFSYSSDLSRKKPIHENLKHFGTGFLSVILATPCTVPFLGVAAAYSFSRGAVDILLLHLFTALGFITPYALIFIGVDISRLIPQIRPLEHYIKKSLGFIIILTMIWLIDIYWTLTGEGIPLLGGLWVTVLGLWGYGEIQKKHPSLKWEWKFWSAALLLWVAMITWLPWSPKEGDGIKEISGVGGEVGVNEEQLKIDSSLSWITFDKGHLEELLNSSKVVYVHFTADWCLNCKVNEKLILEREEVIDLFKKYEVIMMKADWTRSNDEIFDEIQSLGRAGIPLDVLYRNDRKLILSSVLTVGEIRSSLEELIGDE